MGEIKGFQVFGDLWGFRWIQGIGVVMEMG